LLILRCQPSLKLRLKNLACTHVKDRCVKRTGNWQVLSSIRHTLECCMVCTTYKVLVLEGWTMPVLQNTTAKRIVWHSVGLTVAL
jgi:hypothetical protein